MDVLSDVLQTPHLSNCAFVPLLAELPNLVTIDLSESASPNGLGSVLDYIVREAGTARPGSASLVFRFAELFFAEILRRHCQDVASDRAGWIAALNDPVLSRALQLLHREPARDWTVEQLARHAATSRSTLAGRFKKQRGYGPIHYLTKWRIQIAARKLSESDVKVSDLAGDVGFASESAFYRAFTRETGMSPGSWRRQPAQIPARRN